MRYLLLLLGCLALLGAEQPATDPLNLLPVLPATKPVIAQPHGDPTTVAPGIITTPTAVVLEGQTLLDSGPVDGMEVIACLEGGKYHEGLLRLATGNGQLVKFAMIRVLGYDDGQPAIEASAQPARGTPVRMLLEWPDPDHPAQWLALDASCMVRDRVTDRAYPPLPFVYTGSRIITVTEPAPDGKQVKRQRFMLDITKSMAVAFDEPDCLLASPFPFAGSDQRFEANSAITPPPGTPVRLVVTKAELPLTLVLSADGALRTAVGEAALEDVAIQGLLAKHYGAGANPGLRAVGVRLADPAIDHAVDVAARARLLAAAATAKAWVIPVFILP